jgi:hypothetical protein
MSKYCNETSTNIKHAYRQLPYYQRNNPSLREPNYPNDQLHPQEVEELVQYLADIFSHINTNEQEESIQQTTKQASHQKNRDKKRTQRKKAQIKRKKTNEQQKRRTTTCPNQTQKISRNLKESGSHNQRP